MIACLCSNVMGLTRRHRFRTMPSFSRAIRRFTNNVSEMKKLAARDFEDILQVSLFLDHVTELAHRYGLYPQNHLRRYFPWHPITPLCIGTISPMSLAPIISHCPVHTVALHVISTSPTLSVLSRHLKASLMSLITNVS